MFFQAIIVVKSFRHCNYVEAENITSSVCLFVSTRVFLLGQTRYVQLLLNVPPVAASCWKGAYVATFFY